MELRNWFNSNVGTNSELFHDIGHPSSVLGRRTQARSFLDCKSTFSFLSSLSLTNPSPSSQTWNKAKTALMLRIASPNCSHCLSTHHYVFVYCRTSRTIIISQTQWQKNKYWCICIQHANKKESSNIIYPQAKYISTNVTHSQSQGR